MNHLGRRAGLAAGMACGLLLTAVARTGQAQFEIDRPPINYRDAASGDAVERLRKRIESGEVQLSRDKQLGWLPAVLDELRVPAGSQTLVFSKTSLQRRQISPRRPRAIYFSDDVYVGYVRHGRELELSAVDPQLGAVFYTLDQRNRDRPVITRDRGRCLSCHHTHRTRGVPGYLVRSVFADSRGEVLASFGSETTDHRTPFEKRFGGWFVTGTHGEGRHRGNAMADAGAQPPIDTASGANLTTLEGLTSTGAYPEAGSDIVALMVLEHQSQVHNAIAKAGYHTRVGMHFDDIVNRMAGDPLGTVRDSTKRRIASAGEQLLQCLLMTDEAALPSPVEGTSGFADEFASRGPFDSQRRSLREFDLQQRLFRYPCSSLIYSPSIDALPAPMLDYLRGRLHEVLTGEDQSAPYSHLSADDRRAILEILRATKPDRLP